MKIILDELVILRYNDIRSSDGLSPNGKATDSDSVIFKVRILVAQLRIQELFPGFFVFQKKSAGYCIYRTKVLKGSAEKPFFSRIYIDIRTRVLDIFFLKNV